MSELTSPTGWLVRLKRNRVEPVVDWDKHGNPIFVDPKGGRAVSILDLHIDWGHPIRLEPATPPVVAALPANGWRLRWRGDGKTGIEELIGFAVRADGEAVPIRVIDGDHGESGPRDSESLELIPPGETETEATSPWAPSRLGCDTCGDGGGWIDAGEVEGRRTVKRCPNCNPQAGEAR